MATKTTYSPVEYRGMTAWAHEECGGFRWWNTKQGPEPTDACVNCDAATGTWEPLFKRQEMSQKELAMQPGRYCCDGFGFTHPADCPRYGSKYQVAAGRTDQPGYKGNAPR